MHVVNNAVSKDQEDEVFLISLAHFCFFSHVGDELNDRLEICWPVQLYFLKCFLVGVHDFLEPIALWIENISIERETVACFVKFFVKWRHFRSVAEYWDLLLRVIILQDVASCLDGCQVLVSLHVEVVE